MDFEKIAEIWNAQEQPSIAKNETDLLNRLREDHRQDERRLLWLNFQEVLPCVFLFIAFGGIGLADSTDRWAWFLAAALCLGVGLFLVASTIRQRRKEAVFGDSVKDQLNRALSQVHHRDWLYRNILWWYLSPIAVGLGAIVNRKMLADGVSVADTIYVIVVSVLCYLIYRANRRIARCEYRPRVERLEAMLRQFESSDAHQVDALREH